jgi:hypothetical protein
MQNAETIAEAALTRRFCILHSAFCIPRQRPSR